MTKHKIAFVCGSLRKDSFHRRLGHAVAKAAGDRIELVEVAIGDLPLYDEDSEKDGPPAEWTRFRDAIRGTDGVLLWKTPLESSTWTEQPVVVDVDNDGHADLVVSSA